MKSDLLPCRGKGEESDLLPCKNEWKNLREKLFSIGTEHMDKTHVSFSKGDLNEGKKAER